MDEIAKIVKSVLTGKLGKQNDLFYTFAGLQILKPAKTVNAKNIFHPRVNMSLTVASTVSDMFTREIDSESAQLKSSPLHPQYGESLADFEPRRQ